LVSGGVVQVDMAPNVGHWVFENVARNSYPRNISLRASSIIGGDIIIQDCGDDSDDRDRPLTIELEDGSVVEGNILVEDETTPVEVHLSGGSRVMGRIENAEVIEN